MLPLECRLEGAVHAGAQIWVQGGARLRIVSEGRLYVRKPSGDDAVCSGQRLDRLNVVA